MFCSSCSPIARSSIRAPCRLDETRREAPDYFVSSRTLRRASTSTFSGVADVDRLVDLETTATVPTNYRTRISRHLPLRHEKGLKGCTTFRFNPEGFRACSSKERTSRARLYRSRSRTGPSSKRRATRKSCTTARRTRPANLFDALKEGYYGKLLGRPWPASPSTRRSQVLRREAEERRSRRRSPNARVSPQSSDAREARASRGAHRLHVQGSTPVSDHAMYVTINDIVLNEGTPHEQRRPFEIFLNSKNRSLSVDRGAPRGIMSAVFRKGGDVRS